VTEKGAVSRRLYLPRGTWYDFWCQERKEGGVEITRPVDLATIPLYVRAGAIIPLGPVQQYSGEDSSGSLTLSIYPGADGKFQLYEDDGVSFDHRKGDWMGIVMNWLDRDRRLTMQLADGSKMRPPLERQIKVQLVGENATQSVVFAGKSLEVRW
jgi:alpha-glucosidase/alpha-D-xyloside xylohydrolase